MKKTHLRGHYTENVDAFIVVVDSCDMNRIGELNEELYKTISSKTNSVPILVFWNKTDIKESKPVTNSEKLTTLNKFKYVLVKECCATKSLGLKEGLDFLYEKLK